MVWYGLVVAGYCFWPEKKKKKPRRLSRDGFSTSWTGTEGNSRLSWFVGWLVGLFACLLVVLSFELIHGQGDTEDCRSLRVSGLVG